MCCHNSGRLRCEESARTVVRQASDRSTTPGSTSRDCPEYIQQLQTGVSKPVLRPWQNEGRLQDKAEGEGCAISCSEACDTANAGESERGAETPGGLGYESTYSRRPLRGL